MKERLFAPSRIEGLSGGGYVVFVHNFSPVVSGGFVPFGRPVFGRATSNGKRPCIRRVEKTSGLVNPPFRVLSSGTIGCCRGLGSGNRGICVSSLACRRFVVLNSTRLDEEFSVRSRTRRGTGVSERRTGRLRCISRSRGSSAARDTGSSGKDTNTGPMEGPRERGPG